MYCNNVEGLLKKRLANYNSISYHLVPQVAITTLIDLRIQACHEIVNRVRIVLINTIENSTFINHVRANIKVGIEPCNHNNIVRLPHLSD